MMLFSDLPPAFRQALMVLTFACMLCGVYCLFVFIKQRKAAASCVCALSVALGYAVLQCMMSIAKKYGMDFTFYGAEKTATELPAVLMISCFAAVLVLTAVTLYGTLKISGKERKPLKFSRLKVKIHDTFGLSLVASKAYYSGQQIGRDTVKSLYSQCEECFNAEKIYACNSYESIYQIGGLIGVRLFVNGDLPADERLRTLICAALSECMINTYRHAWGDAVYVSVKNGGTVIEITNNGKPPTQTIHERGGLGHLRSFAESMGVSMTVQSRPAFLLTLTLPQGVQYGV